MSGFFRQNAKAIVSALVGGAIAFLSSLLTALQGENTGFDTITDGQWVTAALAFLVGLGLTGGATYRVANAPPKSVGSGQPRTTPAAPSPSS